MRSPARTARDDHPHSREPGGHGVAVSSRRTKSRLVSCPPLIIPRIAQAGLRYWLRQSELRISFVGGFRDPLTTIREFASHGCCRIENPMHTH